jgi:hypothetical protein
VSPAEYFLVFKSPRQAATEATRVNLASVRAFVGVCYTLGMWSHRPFVAYLPAGYGRDVLADVLTYAQGARIIARHVELAAALQVARVENAVLLLGSLNQIAGNVEALVAIERAGIEFAACDRPNVGRRDLPELLTAAGQGTAQEAPAGPPQAKVEQAAHARKARAAQCQVANAAAREAIAEIERAGITSLRAIGRELAARGIKPPAGGMWQATQVARLR